MTNANEGSLMRRTKSELVQIILRKDEVEKQKNEEIDRLNKDVNVLQTKLNASTEVAKSANKEVEDYKDALDDAAYERQMMLNRMKVYKICSFVCGIIAVAAIISLFC